MEKSPLAVLAITLGVVACSASYRARLCQLDVDCGASYLCSEGYCRAPADVPLLVGMSVPLTGPVQDLGTRMRDGVQLAFTEENAGGGVRGRPLALRALDDESQPDLAQSNTSQLVDARDDPATPPFCDTTQPPIGQHHLTRGANAVMAMMGNVGTPPMLRSVPLAVETQTLVFGAHTGSASVLRDGQAGPGCSRYIFNVRPSFAQEARALVEYLQTVGIKDRAHVFSFDQMGPLGDEGFNGLETASAAVAPFSLSLQPITRFRYKFGDATSVASAATQLEMALRALLAGDTTTHSVGVFMVSTYGPSSTLVKSVIDWINAADPDQQLLQKATRLRVAFVALSPIAADSFVANLRDTNGAGYLDLASGTNKMYWEGVVASQTVPNYQTDSGEIVRDFLAAASARGVTPTATALEGYLAGRIFIAGLLKHKGDLDPAALVSTFESLGGLWTGLGAKAGFAPAQHQYLRSVWGIRLNPEGKFSNQFYWEDGSPIRLFGS